MVCHGLAAAAPCWRSALQDRMLCDSSPARADHPDSRCGLRLQPAHRASQQTCYSQAGSSHGVQSTFTLCWPQHVSFGLGDAVAAQSPSAIG